MRALATPHRHDAFGMKIRIQRRQLDTWTDLEMISLFWWARTSQHRNLLKISMLLFKKCAKEGEERKGEVSLGKARLRPRPGQRKCEKECEKNKNAKKRKKGKKSGKRDKREKRKKREKKKLRKERKKKKRGKKRKRGKRVEKGKKRRKRKKRRLEPSRPQVTNLRPHAKELKHRSSRTDVSNNWSEWFNKGNKKCQLSRVSCSKEHIHEG